jgi:uncharacterized protein (DUF2267 family)
MTGAEFVRRVQTQGALPTPKDAERVSIAVLIALSHLAPDSETRRQFVTQLPGALKRRLLAEAPRSLSMDRDALIQHVGAALDAHAPEAERLLRTVYAVLRTAVSPGELEDFEAGIPGDIAMLLRRVA